MTDLLAARTQMAITLAFHIVFACAGMTMPLLMVIAEALGRRTRDDVWLELAKRWATGTAILFAVGAVSGTVLSFELGLLFPRFMLHAGPIVGVPFSLEGFAFFLEAIFLGIYLYGWKRVGPRMHLCAGVVVWLSGLASAAFVLTANAWMNTPTGFTQAHGLVITVDPLAAMSNPAAPTEILHMTIAAFVAVGFAVASIHAWVLLRAPRDLLHRRALTVALSVACFAAVAQPLSGDLSARHVARHQPAKLAAMEGLFETRTEAPLHIGGLADVTEQRVRYGIEVPYGLSLLAFHDPHARVQGLDAFARTDWPPVAVVHIAFQIMVGAGTALALLALGCIVLTWRARRVPDARWFLRTIALAGPLGFVALEAGWVVTEVGRQPWIVHGFMRTSEAVTSVSPLGVHLAVFTLLYLGLAIGVVALLRRHVFASLSHEAPDVEP